MRRLALVATAVACVALAGCGGPNRANVELRREKQELRDRVAELLRQNDQLRSQARALEGNRPAVATLPQDRLEQLFTVAGVRFGRLTGRADEFDGLEVYLEPTDGQGDLLKAAGGVRVEAFDLTADRARLATWEFGLDRAKRLWQSGRLASGYALDLRWADAGATPPPADRPLLIKATFRDGLTGREFTATREMG